MRKPHKPKMTTRERRFCELWAADPEHVGVEAARGAGYRGKNPTLAMTASRLLKRPQAKAYISELSTKAMVKIEKEEATAVANLQECLVYLTTVMRASLPDFIDTLGSVIVEELHKAPAGLVRRYYKTSTTVQHGESVITNERTGLELESAMTAAVRLIEHHRNVNAPQGVSAGAMLEALATVPAAQLEVVLQVLRAAHARDVTPARPQLEAGR